jgi:hypothetical protein
MRRRGVLLILSLVSPLFPQSPRAPSFGFTIEKTPPGSFGAYAVVADFNGDGKPDIARADGGSAISVFLGDGYGNFSQPIITNHLPLPFYLTIADVNGDGKLDLVSYNANYFISPLVSVSVLLGNGDGSFTLAATYPIVAQDPRNPLVIADFNGDGHVDLAFVSIPGTEVNVMLGNSDGTFRPPLSDPNGGLFTKPIFAGDFNGDGIPDLIAAGLNQTGLGQTLTLRLGIGDGTFAPPVNIPAKFDFRDVVVGISTADFNHDGNLDFAVFIYDSYASTGVSVYLGRGDSSFADPVFYPAAIPPASGAVYFLGITIVDITGDGTPDLVTATTGNSDGYLQVFPGNGDGTFQPSAVYSFSTTSMLTQSMAVADLNGDGRPDIVLVQEDGALVILSGTAGPFLRATITHDGDVIEVQTGTIFTADAFFNIQVSNATAASRTTGTVGVVTSFALGQTTSISGDGWTCSIKMGNNSCLRNDPLESGSSYPPIRVDLAVNLGAYPPPTPTPVTISAAASGGGSSRTEVSDTLSVLPIPTN